MKKIMMVVFLSFLLLSCVTQHSYAEPCGFPDNPEGRDFSRHGMPIMHHSMEMREGLLGPGHPGEKRLTDLGLDEKEKDAIREIKSRVIKDVIKKRADIELARVELKDILDKDPVDINAAETTLKKMEALMTDIRLLHIKEMEAIKSKLTPEQRKKFKGPPQRETGEKKNQKSN